MRTDSLHQYVNLRRELTQERDQLSQRLTQLNEALGELSPPSPSVSESQQGLQTPQQKSGGRVGRPLGGGASLREHVLEVLRGGAMTSREVLDAVQRRG